MRVVPTVEVVDVPGGLSPVIVEISRVGCTVIYNQITGDISIDQVHLRFSADF
jgi:hypothetical protein